MKRRLTMRLSLLAPLVVLSAGACCGGLSGSPSIMGHWELFVDNPGGGSIDFYLTSSGSSVSGTGEECNFGTGCHPVTITGRQSCADVYLTIQYSNGALTTFSGQLTGQNELQGTWGGGSTTLIFHRA